MAKFDDLTITNNGLDMIALSQAGAKLIFTKVKLGDGQIGDNDVMKLTDIINERMTAQISSVEAKTAGQVAIKFTVDNSELTSGFFVREIGIFAKINDGGEEQLYAYTNAGNYTNYLADNKTPVDAIITKIDLAVGNATDINFTLDKSIVYVSLEDLDTALQNHNSSSTAHVEAITQHNDDENSHEPAFTKHNNDEDAHQAAFTKQLAAHNTDENAHKNLIDMLMEVIENSGINILKRNKAYNVGDIAYSTKITSTTHLASKLYLECVEAGTSGESEPTLTDVNLNDEITDGTAKFKVYDVGLQSRPVGNIYQSTNATSPEELFGGTWEEMPAGRVLLAQGQSDWGTNYTAGSTGGEATHQLTVGEMPSHNHTGSTNTTGNHNHSTPAWFGEGSSHDNYASSYDTAYSRNTIWTSTNGNHSHTITINNTGSNQSHNNMQPYTSCYIWKRTA